MIKLLDSFPTELKKQVSKNSPSNRKYNKNKKKIKYSKQHKVQVSNKNTSTEGINKPTVYAFDTIKKLPLNTKRQISSAMAQLFNVKGTSFEDKEKAYKKIITLSKEFGICTMGLTDKYNEYLSSINSIESEAEKN